MTTYNAVDMVRTVSMMWSLLNTLTYAIMTKKKFHDQRLAHIINLAVKDSMRDAHDKIQERLQLKSTRSSVKPRDLFEVFRR